MGLLEKVFGDLNSKEVKKLEKIADKVMELEGQMEALSDEELKGKTQELFPEGTRYDKNNAKSGAGMLALRTGCTVLPVYVSDDKRIFRRTKVVIGKPFVPEKPEGKLGHDHYAACSDEILRRIYELEPKD